ncbi:MAG: hypothetical protein K0R57_3868 [Paenibacillaceae bacterium]|nr:hypothetical protein [Paenibacillaceae bacterium]
MKKHYGKNGTSRRKAATALAASLALVLVMPAWTASAVEGGTAGSGLTAPASVSEAAAVPAAQKEAAVTVPLRIAAESLGAMVEWDELEQSVRISRDKTVIVVKIGEENALVNGEPVSMRGRAELVNERTMVPLVFIGEALNTETGWDADRQALVLKAEDVEGRASQFLYNLIRGHVRELLAESSAPLRKTMQEAQLAGLAAQLQPLLGQDAGQVSSSTESNGVHTSVTMQYQTKAAPVLLEAIVRFDSKGMVDDYTLSNAPAPSVYKAPEYDKPETYKEQEVVVGTGVFALPGTLTLPREEGTYPAVVLVHGSGPNNRDSAIGGAKPFKDLAAGLASKGIAVLRYEKITREHPAKLAAGIKITLQNETVDDVHKAVALLRETPGIDPERIYVVGHSQGGYAAPLMLEGDQTEAIAGAVLLAAPSGNISDVLREQQWEALERLKQTNQPAELIAQQEMAAAAYEQIVAMIQDPAYSADNLPPQFPLGDAYWWYEQRDYQPAQTANSQSVPMLILQGENDWQVSMKEFNGWKETLKADSRVEYKSYPKVNHLLAEYDGISTGLEYTQPSNVSPQIIEDIAQWVKKQ